MASKDSIKYALGKFAEAELAHLPNHFVSNVKSKLDKIVDDRFSKDPNLTIELKDKKTKSHTEKTLKKKKKSKEHEKSL